MPVRRCPQRSARAHRVADLVRDGSDVFGPADLPGSGGLGAVIVAAMTTLTRPAPGPPPPATPRAPVDPVVPDPWHPRTDDDLIAYTLIVLWALATGRRPPTDVPPALLDDQALIDFWCDPGFDDEEVPRP